MREPIRASVIWIAVAVILLPVQARADGYAVPWVGVDFANSGDQGHNTFGVTTGYMAAGVFGFEADIGYSPEFFGLSDAPAPNTALTFMGNFIFGVPIGGTHGAGVRPFLSGGFGLLRTQRRLETNLTASAWSNEFCYDLGVGMMGFFNQHIGLRGDVKYLRALQDTDRASGTDFEPGKRRYWRVSAGLTFR